MCTSETSQRMFLPAQYSHFHKLGPNTEDWEEVAKPEDHGISDYEIQLRYRWARY